MPASEPTLSGLCPARFAAIGFAMNQMRGDAIVGDRRTHALCKALYEPL